MNIEQKLELLAKESLQLRLQLMINDIQLFDYYQLALLNNQIESIMEVQKQKQADLVQDQEKANQMKAIESEASQIQQTKERSKRPRIKNERIGKMILRTSENG